MPTSSVELTNVSPHGLWLLLDGQELFVAFREFPWFETATIKALAAVERPSPHHLYWPDLDVDLAVDSLFHPERYPLIGGARSNRRLQLPVRKRGGRAKKKQSSGRVRRAARS